MICLQMVEAPDAHSKMEEIYHHYRHTMYAVAYGILNNQQDAEDAVQSAFVKIAEHISKIDEVLSPKAKSFVIIITENQAIDIYRRKQRHPQTLYCDETMGLQVEYTGTVELAGCFAKLPARYREILLLRHRHGYSTREIAGILGLTLSNASKLEQRAKKKLEIICKEEGVL